MTEWRAVTGFEGFYEISDDGQVRSIDRWILIRGNRTFLRGVPRKAFPKPRTGHLAVVLRREGQHYSRHVHTLVLEAFVGPRPDGYECCHRDGNVNNNHVSNLYWGTRADNYNDSVRHKTHNQRRKTHCPQNHPYDDENTLWVVQNGRRSTRQCRTCNRARASEWRRKKTGVPK